MEIRVIIARFKILNNTKIPTPGSQVSRLAPPTTY